MKKNDYIYDCEICDFFTCKKTNYELHLQTQKHIRNTLATSSNIDATEKMNKCNTCGKQYKDRTGLWRHRKRCNMENTPIGKLNNSNEEILEINSTEPIEKGLHP